MPFSRRVEKIFGIRVVYYIQYEKYPQYRSARYVITKCQNSHET